MGTAVARPALQNGRQEPARPKWAPEKEREIGWLAVYKDEGARDSVMVITADTPVEKSSVKLQIGHYLLNDELATDASDAALTGAGSAGQDEPQEEE